MPKLSVVITAYNSEKTIEECLRAVKSSGYSDHELIVVDDGSGDSTVSIVKEYADNVIELGENKGRVNARKKGFDASTGEIIVNIDSDSIVRPDTLQRINDYFDRNPKVDAVTGLLSKHQPNKDLFSQYKNLYMHYIFSKLPERVSFLYGSIYAVRRNVLELYAPAVNIADDTALGQEIFSRGGEIAFLRDLEVVHLKEYDFLSFFRNDFRIPFDWAKIFLKNKAWKQLGRNKTGFAHSPKEQLASVILAPVAALSILASFSGYLPAPVAALLVVIWLFLNLPFLLFLTKEKGAFFGLLAILVTFIDNIVMAMGIVSGSIIFMFRGAKKQ